MVDEFIHWPKPYLLLSSTYDETLLWMITLETEWEARYLDEESLR